MKISHTNSPQKLHHEFVRLGGLRHKLKNKMLAILPQIYESGIWKKYAGSIVEYAGKYGDIAKTTVIKRLRLEETLEGLPFLKAAIEKVGVHKVSMIAKIATPENDEKLAESVLNMSKMAVQSLSKELRVGQGEESTSGSQQLCGHDCDHAQSLTDHQSLPCKAVPITKKIELDEESTFLFLKLKAKLGKNLSDKEFLKHILGERERQEFPWRQNKITNRVVLQKNVTAAPAKPTPATSPPIKNAQLSRRQTANALIQTATNPTRYSITQTATVRAKIMIRLFRSVKFITNLRTTV